MYYYYYYKNNNNKNNKNNLVTDAMETLGSMNDSAYHFFKDFGCKISEVSGDSREGSFIFQRLSIDHNAAF